MGVSGFGVRTRRRGDAGRAYGIGRTRDAGRAHDMGRAYDTRRRGDAGRAREMRQAHDAGQARIDAPGPRRGAGPDQPASSSSPASPKVSRQVSAR
ncbi:hypothetical protein GCM10009577_85160 [Streptomyces javensis]